MKFKKTHHWLNKTYWNICYKRGRNKIGPIATKESKGGGYRVILEKVGFWTGSKGQ
jgi:hypothetical protein